MRRGGARWYREPDGAQWQRSIEVPSMPFSIMEGCPSACWSRGSTQTWQHFSTPRVRMSKHWKWVIIFSQCSWKTTIRPNEGPHRDLLWALINGVQHVRGLFTESNSIETITKPGIQITSPVTAESIGRAKVLRKWVRIHFKISRFSQGLQI